MQYLLFILFICTLLAFRVKKEGKFYLLENGVDEKSTVRPLNEQLAIFFIFLIFLFFAGFRAEYNDTVIYIHNFLFKIPDSIFDLDSSLWSYSNNPLFVLYMTGFKEFISQNPYAFIFVTSFITLGLFLISLSRFSYKFGLTIFLFITTGLFVFSMAAMKQVLAMSIGFFALQYFLQNKTAKFIGLIVFASFIHTYVLLYLLIPFLKNEVWSKKMVLMYLGAVLAGYAYNAFVGSSLDITSFIGENYEEILTQGQGMNIFRVMIYQIIPILSIIYRKEINIEANKLITICINMSIIGGAFMLIGIGGGAVMFGRMGIYCDIFSIIVLPWIIYNVFAERKRKLLTLAVIICYIAYFYYQYGIAKPFIYKNILDSVL